MCGIAGFFDKTRDNRNSSIGQILMTMLKGLACRGPDSAGVALFGPSADHQAVLRVKLGDEEDCSALIQTLTQFLDSHYGDKLRFFEPRQFRSLGGRGSGRPARPGRPH